GELALEAVIGLGAVVVGLEIRRVAEARADIERERHHVDPGRGAIDPVGHPAGPIVAPQEALGVACRDPGGLAIRDAAGPLRLQLPGLRFLRLRFLRSAHRGTLLLRGCASGAASVTGEFRAVGRAASRVQAMSRASRRARIAGSGRNRLKFSPSQRPSMASRMIVANTGSSPSASIALCQRWDWSLTCERCS